MNGPKLGSARVRVLTWRQGRARARRAEAKRAERLRLMVRKTNTALYEL